MFMHDVDATINVEVKTIGKRAPIHPSWHVVLPAAFLQEQANAENPFRLRDLIEYIVCEEVRAFRLRQENHRLLRVLSTNEIADAASQGKIVMGGPPELQT